VQTVGESAFARRAHNRLLNGESPTTRSEEL